MLATAKKRTSPASSGGASLMLVVIAEAPPSGGTPFRLGRNGGPRSDGARQSSHLLREDSPLTRPCRSSCRTLAVVRVAPCVSLWNDISMCWRTIAALVGSGQEARMACQSWSRKNASRIFEGRRSEFRFALSRLHAGALRALGLSAGDLRRHRFIGAAQDDDLVKLAVLVSL